MSFLLWYHQESNRGHKDFQSFALPTELWYHFAIAGANIRTFSVSAKRYAQFFDILFGAEMQMSEYVEVIFVKK